METLLFLLCFCGTNIVHFSLIVSIATSMYTFAGVPQNVVGQSIVLRDSLSFGQFDLVCRLKSPRKIILGRGEGSDITYVWIFNDISSKSFTGQEGGR